MKQERDNGIYEDYERGQNFLGLLAAGTLLLLIPLIVYLIQAANQ